MKRVFVVGVLALAVGCAGGLEGDGGDDMPPLDSASSADAQPVCGITLSWDPDPAIKSDNIKLRVDAHVVGAPGGIFSYTWNVSHGGNAVAFEDAQADRSAIQFPIPTSGIYTVQVDVDAGTFCQTGFAPINVEEPGALTQEVRVRVRPPATSNLPPRDKFVPIKGGQDMYTIGGIVLDAGRMVSGFVGDGNTPIASYLKFIPIASRDAYVEQFAGASGTFGVRVVSEPHDVLIIPATATYAPMLVKAWTPDQSTFSITPGDPITGVVRDSANQPIANAVVQLTIAGVPSTIAETDASGNFTVLGRKVAGASVVVDVTPPAARGLPRLVATSTLFDLGTDLAVRYTIGTRNVGTSIVRRNGNAIANARVSLVGTSPNIGTVTAGPSVTATGTTRLVVIADGNGKLPSTLAPAAALSAVTQVTAADLAVSDYDLRTVVPVLVDAPPRVAITTALKTSTQDVLPNGILDAIPAGPLALAGAPALRLLANASGAVSGQWPANSEYDLRAHDPAGLGSLKRYDGVTPATLADSYSLGEPLRILGNVTSAETLQAIPGASVQILCASCTGIERDRPYGETATDGAGNFNIVVPDPGTSQQPLQRDRERSFANTK